MVYYLLVSKYTLLYRVNSKKTVSLVVVSISGQMEGTHYFLTTCVNIHILYLVYIKEKYSMDSDMDMVHIVVLTIRLATQENGLMDRDMERYWTFCVVDMPVVYYFLLG